MREVTDMSPFEIKRWAALIDAVQLIDRTATKRGINMNDPKECQECLNPKYILNYMEEASSMMR